MRASRVLILSLSLVGACAHSKIAQTQIDDTEENRQILSIVEEYTKAVEARDADAVLALVSPRYYEDNGNSDRADDYDLNGLSKSLKEDFARTKAMQLQVRVDQIDVTEVEAYAELYYTYRAENEYASGTQWDTGSDRARIRFQRENGQWRIIAGL